MFFLIYINFFKFSDIIACVAPIGIFLGRVANFINGELYGKISTLPWAVIFPNVDSMPRHPSQLYEAILEGVVLFIIINYLALKKERGTFTAPFPMIAKKRLIYTCPGEPLEQSVLLSLLHLKC